MSTGRNFDVLQGSQAQVHPQVQVIFALILSQQNGYPQLGLSCPVGRRISSSSLKATA